MPESKDTHDAQPPPIFVTTRWSVVLAAQDKSSPDSAAVQDALCHAYWYPLYAYVRGTGRSPHDAQDLTQEFFARLLAQDWLRVVLPEKGRFRTFLRLRGQRNLATKVRKDERPNVWRAQPAAYHPAGGNFCLAR